jgi:hypothetical protein
LAWHSEDVVRKDCAKEQARRETPKRRKDGERLWKLPECSNGIRSQGVEEQEHRSMGNGNKVCRKTIGIEFVKQAHWTSSGLQRLMDWNLWTGQPTSKKKKETTGRAEAGNVDTPAPQR